MTRARRGSLVVCPNSQLHPSGCRGARTYRSPLIYLPPAQRCPPNFVTFRHFFHVLRGPVSSLAVVYADTTHVSSDHYAEDEDGEEMTYVG